MQKQFVQKWRAMYRNRMIAERRPLSDSTIHGQELRTRGNAHRVSKQCRYPQPAPREQRPHLSA